MEKISDHTAAKEFQPTFELLVDYVDGILNESTVKKIEECLAKDEVLRGVTEGIRYFYEAKGNDRDALEAYADDFRERLDQSLENTELPKANTSKQPLKQRSIGFYALRIAAAVTLLIAGTFVVMYLTKAPTADALVAGYLESPYYDPPVTRGNNDVFKELWQDAVTGYQNGNYASAIPPLQQIIKEKPDDFTAQFYLSLCYLYSQPPNTTLAVEHLTFVVESSNKFNRQALWFLALAYYQEGEIARAKSTLNKITALDDPEHHMKSDAEKLLQLLE